MGDFKNWEEHENFHGASLNAELKSENHRDGNGTWSAAMAAKGYAKGPHFMSYEELFAWDLLNTRTHVRSRSDRGYQIYFTDGALYNIKEERLSSQDSSLPIYKIDNNIPF